MKCAVPAQTNTKTSVMRRRLLNGICCAMLLMCVPVFPQPKLSSIDFHGNRHFSQRELLQSFPLAVAGNVSQERLQSCDSLLRERYRREGYFFAKIDSAVERFSGDSATVSLSYYLDEGSQSLVSRFAIRGARLFTADDIRAGFETASGKPLSQATLEADIDNLLTRYENAGYPLASIRIDSLVLDSLDASNLTFTVDVREGPRVTIKEINVEGNASTRSYVIAREASMQQGELYSQEKVDRFRRKLERLGIFSSVGEPQLYLSRDPSGSNSVGGGLSVAVQEGSTNNFDGIVGYAPPPTSGGSGYFTGNVFISMRNLFGTGRKAVVQWQRESPFTQQIQANYVEPWVAGYPVNLGAGIFQRKQDSLYIKTQYNLRTDFSLTDEFSLAATVNEESVDPSADLNYFTVFESNLLSVGGELRYDTRDNIRSPRSGIAYSTTYSRGTKRITGPAQYLELADNRKFLVEQFAIDLESYLPTFARQVLLVGFHGKKISSSQLEQSDLFQIGGINSVRGYLENQFYGSQVVWSNCEYRFLVGRYSSLFGFFDAGYFSRPPDLLHQIASQEKLLYGYGIGTNLETALGIFRVSFALGQGDGFSTAKIHFGLANDF